MNETVPRPILLTAGALLLLAFGLTIGARATQIGTLHLPSAMAVQVLDARFQDRADGAVLVRDASGADLAVLAPGTNGFVRGVLRGLVRDRKLESLARDSLFRLTRWSDGRITIADPSTGRVVDLGAFGHTNTEAFAQILGKAAR